MLQQLWTDESGIVISAELVLILTICVMGVIVGLDSLALAINEELVDSAHAIGFLNQSYVVSGFSGCRVNGLTIAFTVGSNFLDDFDSCDNLTSGDIVTATVLGNNSGG